MALNAYRRQKDRMADIMDQMKGSHPDNKRNNLLILGCYAESHP